MTDFEDKNDYGTYPECNIVACKHHEYCQSPANLTFKRLTAGTEIDGLTPEWMMRSCQEHVARELKRN